MFHNDFSWQLVIFGDIWWLLVIFRDNIWKFIVINQDISWLIMANHHQIGKRLECHDVNWQLGPSGRVPVSCSCCSCWHFSQTWKQFVRNGDHMPYCLVALWEGPQLLLAKVKYTYGQDIYCRMPVRWGLQQTSLAPGSDETQGLGPGTL